MVHFVGVSDGFDGVLDLCQLEILVCEIRNMHKIAHLGRKLGQKLLTFLAGIFIFSEQARKNILP